MTLPKGVIMASDVRIKLLLECTNCKRRNYASEKNRRNTTTKLELKKYCPWCDKHLPHKEVKV
jgi:large subunit ribosomal protein L33